MNLDIIYPPPLKKSSSAWFLKWILQNNNLNIKAARTSLIYKFSKDLCRIKKCEALNYLQW